jgi:uncharacterized membrane protein
MMFLWLPLLFLIPFAVFWTARTGGGVGSCGMSHSGFVPSQGSGGPEPMDILRQRLARGEITSAEYEEIQRVLG